MSIIYPVSRLLAQPKLFYAIANYLGGPDAETLRSSFYELLELEIEDKDPQSCTFEAEEVYFGAGEDGINFLIEFDTGNAYVLTAVSKELHPQIRNEKELAATSAVYQKLVSVIEESCPEFKGDIALCSPPTPGNNFLSSESGDSFEGSFHLKSNPEKKFSFNIAIIDPEVDEMQATIKPI